MSSPFPSRSPSRSLGNEVRTVRHRLHAARHHQARILRQDRLPREHHRFEAGAADLIDGEGSRPKAEARRRARPGARGSARDPRRPRFPGSPRRPPRRGAPARRTASFTTIAPSSVALKPLSAPRNFPVGVRTALTMKTSVIESLPFVPIPLAPADRAKRSS